MTPQTSESTTSYSRASAEKCGSSGRAALKCGPNWSAGGQQSARTLAHIRLSSLAGALKCFRPYWSGWREKETLSETNVIFEKVDDCRLSFDPFGDEIDAGTREQVGKILGVDIGVRSSSLVKEQSCRHFQEPKRPFCQLTGFHVQVGDMIHRKTEAALGQGCKALMFERSEAATCRLGEFEHQ